MTTPDDSTRAFDELPILETQSEIAALRAAGFALLLEHGTPVTTTDWAERSRVDEDRVEEILRSPAMQGRVELDERGRLLGIAGLTITPTRHALDIDGTTRWTWCALDAVGILGALEATGTIRSTDPQSGAAIEINVDGGMPAGDTSLFILGGYDSGNIREDWCPRVNFFANRDDAEAWVRANELDGDIVSVAEIAVGATAMWRPVVEPST